MKNIFMKLYNFSSSWTGTIIIVLSVIFFIAQAFVIPSGSMKNSLLVGDMLFVKKFAYGIPTPTIPWIEVPILPDFNNNGHLIEGDKPKRGDIVVFRYPNNPKIHYVKRCVATGGDILMVLNKDLLIHFVQGDNWIKKHYKDYELITLFDRLWVKNPYQKEHIGIHHDSSVTPQNTPYEPIFNTMPIEVPEGEFFMMGDNRDHSNDSRFWGTVKYRYIVGTPWFVYFSWDRDYKIRWDRVFRGILSIEKLSNKYNNKHLEGIY